MNGDPAGMVWCEHLEGLWKHWIIAPGGAHSEAIFRGCGALFAGSGGRHRGTVGLRESVRLLVHAGRRVDRPAR